MCENRVAALKKETGKLSHEAALSLNPSQDEVSHLIEWQKMLLFILLSADKK